MIYKHGHAFVEFLMGWVSGDRMVMDNDDDGGDDDSNNPELIQIYRVSRCNKGA